MQEFENYEEEHMDDEDEDESIDMMAPLSGKDYEIEIDR